MNNLIKKISYSITLILFFSTLSFTQVFKEIPNHPTGNSLDIQAFNKASNGKISPSEFILEYEANRTQGVIQQHFSYDKRRDQIDEILINTIPNSGVITLYLTFFKEKHYFMANGNEFWEYDPATKETTLIPLPVSTNALNGLVGELNGKIYINAFQKLYAFDGDEMTLVNTNWNGLTFFGLISSPKNVDDFWLYFSDANDKVTLASFDGDKFTSLLELPIGLFPWQSPGPAEDRTYFHFIENGVESPLQSFNGVDLIEYDIPFNSGVQNHITTIEGIDMLSPNNDIGLYLNDNGNFKHELSNYSSIEYRGAINGEHYFSGLNSIQESKVFIYNSSNNTFNEILFELNGHTFVEMGAIHNDINFLAFRNDNTSETVLVTYDGTNYKVFDNPPNRQYINFRGAAGNDLIFSYRNNETDEGMAFRFDNSNTSSTKTLQELNTTTTLFPNPAQNSTNIKVKSQYNIGELNINLFSIDGKLIQQYHYDQIKNKQFSQEIITSSLPSGLYNIQAVSELGIWNKKLIVK